MTLRASINKLFDQQLSALTRWKNRVSSCDQVHEIAIEVEQKVIDCEGVDSFVASGNTVSNLDNAVGLAWWVGDCCAWQNSTGFRRDVCAVQCYIESACASGRRGRGKSGSGCWRPGNDNDDLVSVIARLGQSSNRVGSVASHIGNVFAFLASINKLSYKQLHALTRWNDGVLAIEKISDFTLKVKQEIPEGDVINSFVAGGNTVNNLKNAIGLAWWVGDCGAR